jgi:aquaporin Z
MQVFQVHRFASDWRDIPARMYSSLLAHWPEYLMEAAQLFLYMISAGIFTILVQSPASSLYGWIPSPLLRRAVIGVALGLTSIVLVYSPWGRQSGGHFNPAITITYWRLGKVKTLDALFYVAAQIAGGTAGVAVLSLLVGDLFRLPPVNYVTTQPGSGGLWLAFAGELILSFFLMSTILFASNRLNIARYTGLFTGALVALFITFEQPISGMSLNPARTFSSALPAESWRGWWIYFVGPVIGMLFAIDVGERLFHWPMNACAKLYHDNDKRCIFCGRQPGKPLNSSS